MSGGTAVVVFAAVHLLFVIFMSVDCLTTAPLRFTLLGPYAACLPFNADALDPKNYEIRNLPPSALNCDTSPLTLLNTDDFKSLSAPENPGTAASILHSILSHAKPLRSWSSESVLSWLRGKVFCMT